MSKLIGVRTYDKAKVLSFEEISRRWKIVTRLKEIDDEYRTNLINFLKY